MTNNTTIRRIRFKVQAYSIEGPSNDTYHIHHLCNYPMTHGSVTKGLIITYNLTAVPLLSLSIVSIPCVY